MVDTTRREPPSNGVEHWKGMHRQQVEVARKLREEGKLLARELARFKAIAQLVQEHGGFVEVLDWFASTTRAAVLKNATLTEELAASAAERSRLLGELGAAEELVDCLSDKLTEERVETNLWRGRYEELEARKEGALDQVVPVATYREPPSADEKRAATFLGVSFRQLRTWDAIGVGPKPPYKEAELAAYLPWVESEMRKRGG